MIEPRYPAPTQRVVDVLKQFGRWNRLFALSPETYAEKYVIRTHHDPDFWEHWTQAKAYEQFEEALEEACREFKKAYPASKIPRPELKMRMRRALLASGWKPVKKRILDELRELRKQRKSEIDALKASLTKKKGRKK